VQIGLPTVDQKTASKRRAKHISMPWEEGKTISRRAEFSQTAMKGGRNHFKNQTAGNTHQHQLCILFALLYIEQGTWYDSKALKGEANTKTRERGGASSSHQQPCPMHLIKTGVPNTNGKKPNRTNTHLTVAWKVARRMGRAQQQKHKLKMVQKSRNWKPSRVFRLFSIKPSGFRAPYTPLWSWP